MEIIPYHRDLSNFIEKSISENFVDLEIFKNYFLDSRISKVARVKFFTSLRKLIPIEFQIELLILLKGLPDTESMAFFISKRINERIEFD